MKPPSHSVLQSSHRRKALWNRTKQIAAVLVPMLTFLLGLGVASHQARHDREVLELERTKAFTALIDHLLSKDCAHRALAMKMATSIYDTLTARLGAMLSDDPCVAVRDAAADQLGQIARMGTGEARQTAREALARRTLAEQLSLPAATRNLVRAGNFRKMHNAVGDERALEVYGDVLKSLTPDARSELDAEMFRQGWTADTKTLGTDAMRYLAGAFLKYTTPLNSIERKAHQ